MWSMLNSNAGNAPARYHALIRQPMVFIRIAFALVDAFPSITHTIVYLFFAHFTHTFVAVCHLMDKTRPKQMACFLAELLKIHFDQSDEKSSE